MHTKRTKDAVYSSNIKNAGKILSKSDIKLVKEIGKETVKVMKGVDKISNKAINPIMTKVTKQKIIAYSKIYGLKSEAELKMLLKEKNQRLDELKEQLKKESNTDFDIKIVKDGIAFAISFIPKVGTPLSWTVDIRTIDKITTILGRIDAIKLALKNKSKDTKLQESYDTLTDGQYLIVNFLDFKEEYSKLPAQTFLENSFYIYSINTESAESYKNFINLNKTFMGDEELSEELSSLEYVIMNSTGEEGIAEDHINTLDECKKILEKEINRRLQESNIMTETYKDSLMESFMGRQTVKNVLNTIKLNPGNLLHDINRVDSLLESYNKTFNNVGPMFVKLLPPVVIIENYFSEYATENMNNITDILLEKINNENNYNNLSKYINILEENINLIDTNMIFKAKLESLLSELKNTKKYLLANVQPLTESSVAYKECNKDELYTDIIAECLVNLSADFITDEQMAENLNTMYKAIKRSEILEEATRGKKGKDSKVWKVAHKIDKGVTKIANNIRDKVESGKRNNAGISNAKETIARAISTPIQGIMKASKEERKKRIIEGKFYLKIWKLITRAVGAGVVFFFKGPLLAVIALVGSVVIDKIKDKRVKDQVLHEIETEIKIVDEKIEDAKSDASKQEKYALMRLKAELEKEHKRIKYSLGPSTSDGKSIVREEIKKNE